MAAPYGLEKANLHLEQLVQLRNNEQPYPVHVQLIISDYCNQDCSFCAYRMSGYSSNELFKVYNTDGSVNNNPKRMIPYEKIEEIIDDCATMGVRAIQLTGGGEPTLHPQFTQIVEKIKSKGIDLALVTNGLLLNEKKAEILKDACWVRISIDAGTPETYADIRRVTPKQFEIVEKNIRRLSSIPDRKVLIGIGFVVVKENYKEILEGCQRFKEWGADNVRLSAMFSNEEDKYYDGIYEDILQRIEAAQKLVDDRFKIYNNFGSRVSDLQQKSPDYKFCGQMHFTTYIGGDQNVYVCCVNAYNDRGLMGSLENQSFKELWDSQAKQEMFAGFDASACSRCMFNDKNRAINRILLTKPTGHDNFV